MARGAVRRADAHQLRRNVPADFYAIRASRVEMAAGGWVEWAGDVAVEDLAVLSRGGIGDGHGGEQRAGVGVRGVLEHVVRGANLDDAA